MNIEKLIIKANNGNIKAIRDLAIKYYRRSLKLNPACVITNNNLGFTYEKKR